MRKSKVNNTHDLGLRKMVVNVDKDSLETFCRAGQIVVNILKEQLAMYNKDVVLANRQQVQMVESSGLDELTRVENVRTELSDSFKDQMELWEGREKEEGSQ